MWIFYKLPLYKHGLRTHVADEGHGGAKASTRNTAVRREVKHHEAVVGQDRRRDAAATQHCYKNDKNINTNVQNWPQNQKIADRRRTFVLAPTDFLSSFYIPRDGEGIIQAGVRLFQVKSLKVELNRNS